ncbi:TetR/AcrR family transcriptional regulator [Chitinophagaceae bacterium MMS25-I14]
MKPKDETKERQIMYAALALIEKSGLAGLSMEAVAKQAKVATGTVYIYFAGKEELLNQLYIYAKTNISKNLFGDYDATAPVKISFHNMCRKYVDYMQKHYSEFVFMLQFMNSPYLSETTKEVTREYGAPLSQMLERGKKELLLKNIDTQLMIIFLQGALGELSGYILKYPAKLQKTYAEQVANLCWDALKA